MSVISKIAILGLTSIGAVIAVAGMSTNASAQDIRDTCHGQVTVGDDIIVNPGDRERGRVDVNNAGRIEWYCDNGEGRTAHREDCMDGDSEVATVEVRLREDGGLRITCR